MKKNTLFLLFFCSILKAQTADWSWVKSFENINNISAITDSFMDSQKNIYHIGVFRSPSITIDGTVITNSSITPTNPNIQYQDTYITKHDSNGNLLYVKHFIGTKYEGLTSIAYDGSNHFYMTGYYNGSVTLGNTTYESQNDQNKCFLAKLDLNGNIIWSKELNFFGYPLLKFKDNYLYFAGAHSGNTFTIGNNTTPSAGYTAVVDYMDKTFLSKLDTNGNVIWLKSSTYNGTPAINEPHRIGTQPRGLDADNLGNVYVAGVFFCRSTTFGSVTLNKSGNGNNANIFIAKYDSNGTTGWAYTANIASTAHSVVSDVKTDSNNNIYLTGQIYNSQVNFGVGGTLNFNGGQGSFLVKYNTSGTPLWAKAAKTRSDTQPDTGQGLNTFERLFVDSNNNVHVTGHFLKFVNFGNNLVYENVDSNANVFSIKYDTNGNPSDFYKVAIANNTREVKILDVSENENVFYYGGKTNTDLLVLGDFTIDNPTYLNLSFVAKRDKRLSVEEHAASNFTVYPNPSQEQIYVSGTGFSAESMLLTVYDLNGKRIKSLESNNNDTATIDVKDLATGTYILKINGSNTQQSIKFVKN